MKAFIDFKTTKDVPSEAIALPYGIGAHGMSIIAPSASPIALSLHHLPYVARLALFQPLH